MNAFGSGDPHDREHERVRVVADGASGLRAVIAVHDTALGPAAGGVRFHRYATPEEALEDALRLSRTTSRTFALAGLPFGGGAAVIIGDPRADKSEALLAAFGRAVSGPGGLRGCWPDLGTGPEDMAVVARATGRATAVAGDDPAPATALGVCHAMRAAVRHRLGRPSLEGLRVAVQGVGRVGRRVCRLLAKAGAELYVADTDPAAVERAVDSFGATAVPVERVLGLDVDVLAPCAVGGVLNDRTVRRVRAPVICGAAADQLAEPRHGRALADRRVLFVPDGVAGAGGAVSVACGLMGEGEEERRRRVAAIHDTCRRVFELAERRSIPTNEAADRLTEEVLRSARRRAEATAAFDARRAA